jgi:hypothetical protein
MKASAGFVLLLLVLPPGAAADKPLIAVEALRALGSSEETWSWVQTTFEHGRKTKVERFDPSRPEEQWTLVESNGRAPTARELSAYSRKQANDRRRLEERRTKRGEQKSDYEELIREGSLKLIREDLEQVVWGFLPPVKDTDMAELAHSIKGTLTIGKRAPHWFTIEMASENVKLAPSVHIERMYVRLVFRPLAGGGPVMPYESESVFRGRLLLKRVNEHTVTTYSEYRKVAPSP